MLEEDMIELRWLMIAKENKLEDEWWSYLIRGMINEWWMGILVRVDA